MNGLQSESCGGGGGAPSVVVVTEGSPLRDLLWRAAVTIDPEASLRDAATLMETTHVSALLVAGDRGVLTERDLARALAHGVDPDSPVLATATRYPLVVPSAMSVLDACAVMLNEDVRHLVVDDGADGTGVVSIRDVAAVLLQSARPELWLTSLRAAFELPAEIWLG